MTDRFDPSPDPHAAPPGSVPPPSIDPLVPSKEEKTWGMIAHLAALAGFTGIPAANLLGPLIVWLIKKDTMPFVDDQGKESLNFQITMTIVLFVCVALACLLIGFVLLPIVGILDLVLVILAAIKANEGVAYRYPFTLRLIK